MRKSVTALAFAAFAAACASSDPGSITSTFDETEPAPQIPANATVAAGPSCPSGQSLCSSPRRCVDLSKNEEDCGACGNTCAAGQACTGGTCCAPDQTGCGGACVDTRADTANCGACGNACKAGQVCWMGGCSDSCPVGVPTSKGCEVSYDVAGNASEGLPATCGDGQVYNGCSTAPFALRWTDQSPMKPKAVRVALQTSIFCASGADHTQRVTLNGLGNAIGTYSGDAEGCSCEAAGTEHVFELDAKARGFYASGGENILLVSGPNRCVGVKQNPTWGGAVARVTVQY